MRGQAYTLEGTVGAILVVTAVVFGLQAIDTGPFTGGDREADRLETQAQDLLAVAAEDGALSEAVRCYDPASKPVVDGNVDATNNGRFERMLNHTFDRQGHGYELYVSYWTGDDGREERLVSSNSTSTASQPEPGAGVATHRLALYDDEPVKLSGGGRDCSTDGPAIDQVSGFYVPEANEESELYNVVEVRLVVW